MIVSEGLCMDRMYPEPLTGQLTSNPRIPQVHEPNAYIDTSRSLARGCNSQPKPILDSSFGFGFEPFAALGSRCLLIRGIDIRMSQKSRLLMFPRNPRFSVSICEVPERAAPTAAKPYAPTTDADRWSGRPIASRI